MTNLIIFSFVKLKEELSKMHGSRAPQIRRYLATLTLFIALVHLDGFQTNLRAQKPNILFIAVDDLRPELGCNGNKLVHSPNMDALASDGVVFDRHYAAVPTCGASRYSLLSGLYPRNSIAATNQAMMKLLAGTDEGELPETFIHHLRRNNYQTVGIGKISHSADGLVYGYEEDPSDQLELPHSWDQMLFDPGQWGNGWNAFFGYADGSNRQGKRKQVFPYESADVPDSGYPDGLSAQLALKKLTQLEKSQTPFFLAVGFFKPHLPFTAPKKYWDLYQRDEIPLTPTPEIPENVHQASLQRMGEINNYQLGDEYATLDSSLSDDYARKLIHGYYACISYTDAMIGKIIDQLKESGLYESTLIIVWGDHGWHLGDYRVWGKHTLFERSLRSELIIKPPNFKGGGRKIGEVVSSVDIYPTIMELCGLPMPRKSDGNSLASLWHQDQEKGTWKNEAFGYFKRGVSLRTERYRVSKYFRNQQPVIEIFDHLVDPLETKNIAGKDPKLKRELLSKLLDHNPAESYWSEF